MKASSSVFQPVSELVASHSHKDTGIVSKQAKKTSLVTAAVSAFSSNSRDISIISDSNKIFKENIITYSGNNSESDNSQ